MKARQADRYRFENTLADIVRYARYELLQIYPVLGLFIDGSAPIFQGNLPGPLNPLKKNPGPL